MNKKLISFVGALIFLASPLAARAVNTNEVVSRWLNAQVNLHTWTADFTQTRSLKSLTQPLVSTGRVWFAAPNRFRWEIGQPAQTIAVRQQDQLLVIYPKLKRVEKYELGGKQTGPWRDALALLEAGFPRDPAQLESRLSIRSAVIKDGVCEVTLLPKTSSARRMISQIKVGFGTSDYLLRSTELEFADGSIMRNDFKNPMLNEKLDEDLFSPNIPPDFKIVEPLKK